MDSHGRVTGAGAGTRTTSGTRTGDRNVKGTAKVAETKTGDGNTTETGTRIRQGTISCVCDGVGD